MATLTIKNIPDELYERLKKRAAQNRRSINSEAIVCLERELGGRQIDVEQFLKDARRLRKKFHAEHIADEDINAAINEGRPSW